ncbi:MAG TPA: DUF4159 domain-containing protein [Methylomirabilota bacterium]|nr:DUF4159 domain-containing protein [Methylomirabilota bacterium]
MRGRALLATVLFLSAAVFFTFAQSRRSRMMDGSRSARDAAESPPPEWTNAPGFEKDVFTFLRVKYTSARGERGWRSRGGWETDYSDSDLNLSFRLQQLTSLKTDPNGRILELTAAELSDYPWLYMAEPGNLWFEDEEVSILRKYLLNGGFLMADDFWGEDAWVNFEMQIKRVLPEREFVELPLDHPIYHCVFEIKSKGQVPNMMLGHNSQYDLERRTWEQWDAQEVHHRAIFDEKGRLMVIATHNTDNGDGWEREGFSEYYFREFSEKIAYPLGINIIFYAMTH